MKKNNPKEKIWDLSPLFKSDNDPKILVVRKKVEEINKRFVDKWEKRSDYLKNPKILKEALDEYEKLIRNYGTSGAEEYYFYLRTSQDQINPDLKAKLSKARESSVRLCNELRFFEHRLAKIPELKQKEFLKSTDLIQYRYFLKKIFKTAKYLLSEAEEKIINLKAEPAYQRWTQSQKIVRLVPVSAPHIILPPSSVIYLRFDFASCGTDTL